MFDLRRDIFRHMQRMHIGFFDNHAAGRLDVDAINEMFTAGVLAIVDDFLNLTIMSVVMLTMNWWPALLAFAVLPVIFIVTRMFRNSVRESYRRVRAAIARINSFIQEHVSGMSVVQLFNREQRAYDDFEVVNKQHMIVSLNAIMCCLFTTSKSWYARSSRLKSCTTLMPLMCSCVKLLMRAMAARTRR